MKTLYNFLLKEIFFYTFLFLSLFLVLLTLIMGTLNLREVLEWNPSFLLTIKFYFLTALQLLSFLFPLSSFLSILFSLQRLKEEKELLALFSLGYTLRDLFKPFFLFIFLLFFATFLSHLILTPYAKRAIKEAQMKLASSFFENPLPPKTPVSLTNTLYLYVAQSEKIDSKNQLRKVILLESKSRSKRGIYLAKEAMLDLKEGSFLLREGFLFTLSDYRDTEIIKFKEYFLKISREYLKKPDLYLKRGELSLSELKETLRTLKPGSERYFRYLSEYYQRLFYAFSLFPLLLQAIIFGLFFKPQNRFLLFLMGIFFYLLFYFLYNFLVSLGEGGRLSPPLSHLYFNGLFFLLLFFEFQFLKKRGFKL